MRDKSACFSDSGEKISLTKERGDTPTPDSPVRSSVRGEDGVIGASGIFTLSADTESSTLRMI